MIRRGFVVSGGAAMDLAGLGIGGLDAVAGFAGGAVALSYQPPTSPGRGAAHLAASCLLSWLLAPTLLRYSRGLDGSLEAAAVAGVIGMGAQVIVPSVINAVHVMCASGLRWLRERLGDTP